MEINPDYMLSHKSYRFVESVLRCRAVVYLVWIESSFFRIKGCRDAVASTELISFLIYSFANAMTHSTLSRFLFFPSFDWYSDISLFFFLFHSLDICVCFYLCVCVCDFVQSIEHGNHSDSHSGWRRCVVVVEASSHHQGSRVRQSTTAPARPLRPLKILKFGSCPVPNWRAQRRKRRTLSSNVQLNNEHFASFSFRFSKLLLARNGEKIRSWHGIGNTEWDQNK